MAGGIVFRYLKCTAIGRPQADGIGRGARLHIPSHKHVLGSPRTSMKLHRSLSRATRAALALIAAASLAGCYVVPLQPGQPYPTVQTAPSTVVVPAAPGPVTFTARLYPANDMAAAYGVIAAVVTNDLNGRGHFSTAIAGEMFSGEATRTGSNSRDGTANGAGNRGSYLNCRYTMNTATLGSGTCRLNNGALFTMHVGN